VKRTNSCGTQMIRFTHPTVIYISCGGTARGRREDKVNNLAKISVVLAGYLAALLAACTAVYVRILNTQDAMAQASAGMYAFGDFLLFVVVFGTLSLAPTALALFFLRRVEKFWTGLSYGGR
jgi:hypothetical protein